MAHLSQRRFTAQGSSVTAAAAEAATEGCPCGKAGCQPFDVLAVLNKRRPNPNPNPSPSPHPNPNPNPNPDQVRRAELTLTLTLALRGTS